MVPTVRDASGKRQCPPNREQRPGSLADPRMRTNQGQQVHEEADDDMEGGEDLQQEGIVMAVVSAGCGSVGIAAYDSVQDTISVAQFVDDIPKGPAAQQAVSPGGFQLLHLVKLQLKPSVIYLSSRQVPWIRIGAISTLLPGQGRWSTQGCLQQVLAWSRSGRRKRRSQGGCRRAGDCRKRHRSTDREGGHLQPRSGFHLSCRTLTGKSITILSSDV